MQLVLASKSPRRAELLRQMGLTFDVVNADVDESIYVGESPHQYVQRLAISKAHAGFQQMQESSPDKLGQVVLGSDTSVVIGNEILGKPRCLRENKDMIMRLAAKTHQVMTGVAVFNGTKLVSCVDVCDVSFGPITDDQATRYCATGEGADKAGGYGIQGIGGIFAERISGCYSTVVGLPVAQTEVLLGKLNIDTWSMRIDG